MNSWQYNKIIQHIFYFFLCTMFFFTMHKINRSHERGHNTLYFRRLSLRMQQRYHYAMSIYILIQYVNPWLWVDYSKKCGGAGGRVLSSYLMIISIVKLELPILHQVLHRTGLNKQFYLFYAGTSCPYFTYLFISLTYLLTHKPFELLPFFNVSFFFCCLYILVESNIM